MPSSPSFPAHHGLAALWLRAGRGDMKRIMWDEIADPTQPPPPPLGWNIVATSRQGGQRRLRSGLRRLVRLRRAGFRNVFIGRVEDPEALFTAVMELRERWPRLDDWLGKMLPIERTFLLDTARYQSQLQTETAPFLDRLEGRSFHVRLERRGHKGMINTHATEKAVGEFLYAALESRGLQPTVQFRDPDAVVVIEILDEVAGVALVTRDIRQRFPFVKID